MSWIEAPRPEGSPTIPVLGASTMARPSVAVLPPEEGAVLADVDLVGCAGSLSGSRADCPNASGMGVSSISLNSAVVPFSPTVIRVDVSCELHPFFVHRLDAGPIRLVTIAVLRDGVNSAIRVGRSRKAEGWILTDTHISWGHQVAVMLQIISTLSLEVPAFLQDIAGLWGVSPNVQLYLRIGQLLMCMIWLSCLRERLPVSEVEDASVHAEESCARMSHTYCMGVGQPESVPFVSNRPGAYGRLLLAVYVWWKTGLLVSSDWLRPVMRGGGEAGGWAFRTQCAVWMTSAD